MNKQPYRHIPLDEAIHQPGAELIGMVSGIPVNPPNPPEDAPHSERTTEELIMWWRQPFIEWNERAGGWDVRCLDGGAWDRPSFIGSAGGLVAALEIAMRPGRGDQLLEQGLKDQAEEMVSGLQS